MFDQVAAGLQTLSPQELQRLDQLITPELAGLLLKAMPELEPILTPFIQSDLAAAQQGQQGQQPGEVAPQVPGGPAPAPSPMPAAPMQGPGPAPVPPQMVGPGGAGGAPAPVPGGVPDPRMPQSGLRNMRMMGR